MSTEANTVFVEIDAFQKKAEQSVEAILEGSDEHLDLILSIKKPLDDISARFEVLNERLYSELGSYSNDFVRMELMPKLAEVNKICLMVIGAMRSHLLYRDIRQSLKAFSNNLDFLREMMYDLKHFRVNQDSELCDLMDELNDL